MHELQSLIQNKDVDGIIQAVEKNPELLDLKDENGLTGILLIAYNGLDIAFEAATEIKTSFDFYEAIICGKLDMVEQYLNLPDFDLINTYSSDGFSPVSLAAYFNRTEIAKLLIEYNADPNLLATNPSKVNALHASVAKENFELTKFLLQRGAKVNQPQAQNVTALHSAVHRGNLELTKLIIEYGADLHITMDNGDTALKIAEREGHQTIIQLLKSF